MIAGTDLGVHFRAPARMIPCMRPERSAKRSAEGAKQGFGGAAPSGSRGIFDNIFGKFLIILDHFTHF